MRISKSHIQAPVKCPFGRNQWEVLLVGGGQSVFNLQKLAETDERSVEELVRFLTFKKASLRSVAKRNYYPKFHIQQDLKHYSHQQKIGRSSPKSILECFYAWKRVPNQHFVGFHIAHNRGFASFRLHLWLKVGDLYLLHPREKVYVCNPELPSVWYKRNAKLFCKFIFRWKTFLCSTATDGVLLLKAPKNIISVRRGRSTGFPPETVFILLASTIINFPAYQALLQRRFFLYVERSIDEVSQAELLFTRLMEALLEFHS